MKKIISILLLLLMLTSCSQRIDNEVALPNEEENKSVAENVQPTETEIETEKQEQTVDTEDKLTENKVDAETTIETVTEDNQQEQIENKPDSTEEGIKIFGSVTHSNVTSYNNIDTLWADADYVIVGSPTQSYDEATQYLLDSSNKPTDFSNISLAHSYSVRPFNVNKVYKGEDLKLKEIQVCEHVLLQDGEMRVLEGSYPTEKNSKYILFLFKSNTDENQYFPLLYQGKYSLNDNENKEQKNISQDMYKQIKEKFKDEIK